MILRWSERSVQSGTETEGKQEKENFSLNVVFLEPHVDGKGCVG